VRNLHLLDKYRIDTRETHGSLGDGTCGAFRFRSPIDSKFILTQASSEGGWDHVSVSRRDHAPRWSEMEFVRRLFFKDDEWVMQLHVPPAHHINIHPNCLHLWRPQEAVLPTPPKAFV